MPDTQGSVGLRQVAHNTLAVAASLEVTNAQQGAAVALLILDELARRLRAHGLNKALHFPIIAISLEQKPRSGSMTLRFFLNT